ncbi:MAG: hypothetical protein P8166_02915 [Candidatus Thiodiazotropha sp.]
MTKPKPSTSKSRKASPAGVASAAASGSLTPAVPSGSILGGNLMPTGLFSSTQALEADVSGELAGLAPTFGDVLMSIGNGVAKSQDALDRGLVETAKTLSDTKINVVTDVIQELDDDGLPVAENTELIEHEVSLINYVAPTVHEWSHMALSMDLSVGAMDNDTGVTFERKQTSGRVGGVGLFFGFVGFGLYSESERSTFYNRNTSRETDWARGQVRMDAMLRPRKAEKFPAPAEINIGPQIYFAQGAINDTVVGGVVTARSMELLIHCRKADGSANPNVIITLDSGPYGHSFSSTDGFTGNTTNADGQIKVTLTRQIPNPRFLRSVNANVKATLGQIERSVDIRL